MRTLYCQTYFLWLIGEAALRIGLAQDALGSTREGLARASATGERFFVAELHRLLASCRLAVDAADRQAAERDLQTALAEARVRSARLCELRAGMDLAQIWAEAGERRRAYNLLDPICGRFTEGFDTSDLIKARSLLSGLRD